MAKSDAPKCPVCEAEFIPDKWGIYYQACTCGPEPPKRGRPPKD